MNNHANSFITDTKKGLVAEQIKGSDSSILPQKTLNVESRQNGRTRYKILQSRQMSSRVQNSGFLSAHKTFHAHLKNEKYKEKEATNPSRTKQNPRISVASTNPCTSKTKTQQLTQIIIQRQKIIKEYKKILRQIEHAKKQETPTTLKELEKQIKQMQKAKK